MLTDLRENLTSVGRLDIMAAVNQRALEYTIAKNLPTFPRIRSIGAPAFCMRWARLNKAR